MDIFIAGIAATAQLVTTYLGWQVSVRPLRDEKQQRLYERLFLIAGAIGLVAVIATAWRADITQTELKTELRVVTGADNFVYLKPDLGERSERGFRLETQGRGSISAGSYFIVPATATSPSHPDYRRGRSVPFLALHSGMLLNDYLPAGDWRIEFVSSVGHYSQLIEIEVVEGKPRIKRLDVVRADGKKLYPPEKK